MYEYCNTAMGGPHSDMPRNVLNREELTVEQLTRY